eukprot:TCONS_00063711-protein
MLATLGVVDTLQVLPQENQMSFKVQKNQRCKQKHTIMKVTGFSTQPYRNQNAGSKENNLSLQNVSSDEEEVCFCFHEDDVLDESFFSDLMYKSKKKQLRSSRPKRKVRSTVKQTFRNKQDFSKGNVNNNKGVDDEVELTQVLRKLPPKINLNLNQIKKEISKSQTMEDNHLLHKRNIDKKLKKNNILRCSQLPKSYSLPNQSRISQQKLEYKSVEEKMLELQYRDISYSDYELLLTLDDTVKPPTANKSTFNKLSQEMKRNNDIELCVICMGDILFQEIVITLPECGHRFHKACIENWLLNCSKQCPVDMTYIC